VVLVSVCCVVMCWMFEGCSWLVCVGGGRGVGFLSGFCCSVLSSFLVLVFLEFGAFVVFALRIWLSLLAVRR